MVRFVQGRVSTGVLLCLLLAPAGGAQGPVSECREQCRPHDGDVNGPGALREPPVLLVLYGHFHPGSTPMALQRPALQGFLNTQPVDPLREPDLRQAAVVPSAGSSGSGLVATLQSVSSRIEMDSNGWTYHNELGMASALRLVGDPVLYVYLSAGGAEGPGVVPGLRVSAEIRRGTPAAPGGLVAETGGSEATVTLVEDGAGDEDVYEVKVPLRARQAAILHSPGDNLRNRFFVSIRAQQLDASGLVAASQSDWRFHTGVKFPPRLILPAANPLEEAGVDEELRNGVLFVRWRVRSPLGSYDVDPAAVSGSLTDPNRSWQVPVEPVRVESDPHDAHVQALWRLDLRQVREPRPWLLRLEASNHQGTYRFAAEHELDGGPRFLTGASQVPGWEAWAVGLAVAALALSRPRR